MIPTCVIKRVHAVRWGVVREFWEHKRTFWYLPLLFAGLIALAALFIAIKTPNATFFSSSHISLTISDHDKQEEKITIVSWNNAQTVPVTPQLEQRFEEYQFVESQQDITEYRHSELAEKAGSLLPKVFLALGFLIAAYYLLAALFSDRKNNTVLFWKSLPISEHFNVALKLGVGVIVVPLLYLAVSWGALLVVKLLFGTLAQWAAPHAKIVLWAQQIHWFDTIISSTWLWVQCVVWCLPLAMLCLLVSAFAKRAPAVYLSVLFAAVAFLEHLFFDQSFLVGWFIAHNPLVVITEETPWLWVFGPISHLWLDMLLGVLVAVGLYFPAVWFRNYRFEA